ncbi:glutaredoxin family protein [Bacillus shivajii]|uniref:glutaredoxin family protein n=1 Tax=Bacillus shivajii TaxID=1983719 RepID=UPI001CFA2F59|nr:glutaredoxin family protein [Bacillus shivajii]UCZ52627.1 glutaredoxin family protein [Bacillus shivajii]
MPTYYFYTKEDCPLCIKGLAVVKELQRDYRFDIEMRDIYKNDKWLETYQIRIPVLESDSGEVLDEGIISYYTLEEKLKKIFC